LEKRAALAAGGRHRTRNVKARESWQMFTIMAEFIESAERLSELRPAVSIFGSAGTRPDDLEVCVDSARRLANDGFAGIADGGSDVMEAADARAFEGRLAAVDLDAGLPHEDQRYTAGSFL
jgi:hypothetical protein